ncbi:sugar ABC transporter substrate-binding protein [Lactobacillus jensenii]|jgi:ABC transporter sugar-binding protein|uniref:Sugar ABC transporter substrate-binding protein n=3 Tax=Lactobacillus TaxID=1578 RepID=A0A5N1IIL8_LACJE|nr:sugar ABC transporter substrate-binding protein [Lactobacillus jensenii]EEQ67984.2 substrate-binding protein MsmE [Lactobacillus jensenii 1153]ERJ41856.1 sugar ABC transporter substrate-binding protein [Lactobacillus jensenii MD IIE-70(2)]EEQ23874.1 substrate-binding protein MsmE [Lactobacillus jensenii 269-3]EEX27027.1 substrate-binding protein MsmE [Lactobacillus jensenii SJ-7A-US]KAA9236241.1 sugar ABC transporter substrate-binding protein [Lactobacillus jensenii]
MKKFWKTGLAAIACMAGLSLAGCSSQKAQNLNTVTMWVHVSKDDPEGKALSKNISIFNKTNKHGYKAKVEFIPRSSSGGGYEDKINAAVNSGSLPDVLTLDGPNTAAYAHSKIIQPIDKYITNKSDLLPSIVKQGTYKGKLYAVGYQESSVGIYYNKKLFKKAGISDSELPTLNKPWTWDQFLSICKRLKNKLHTTPFNMNLNDRSEWSIYAFAPFVWSANGDIVNSSSTKSTGYFDSAKTASAFKFIQELVKKGYTTLSPKDKGFETGKYPMFLTGAWEIQSLKTQYKSLDWGVLPYPVSPETKKLVSPTGSWQYAMSATAKNKKAAGALVNFLASKEGSYNTDKALGVLPSRKSNIARISKNADSAMKFLIEQNEQSGHARPIIVNYPQISRTFAETVQDVTLYQKNPNVEKVLKKQAKAMQKYLK